VGASVQEVLLALGDFSFDFDWDPDLAAELLRHRHLLVYEGQSLRYCGLILRRDPSPDGLTIGGRLPTWRLGVNKDGPLFRDKTWLSGANKLSNGDFSNGELYWKESQDSTWVIGTAATVTGDLGKDDVLISDESTEAVPGAQYRITATAARASGTIGHVRLRTVYEGRFDPPDLLAGFSFRDYWTGVGSPGPSEWTNYSEFPGDITVVDANTITMGPCTQPQFILNGGFETGDFTDWFTDGPAEADVLDVSGLPLTPSHSGNYVAALVALADGDTGAITAATGPGIAVGETWRLAGFAREIAGTSGEAKLSLIVSNDNATADFAYSSVLRGSNFSFSGAEGEWKLLSLDYEVRAASPQAITLLPRIEAQIDNTGGEFQYDDLTLTRVKGNICKITSPEVTIVPERTYKLTVPITGSWSGTGAVGIGKVHAYVALKGTGRPDQAVLSNEIDLSQTTTQAQLMVDVTPPSGYDRVQVTYVAVDVQGGSVTVDRATLRDNDTTTYAVDVRTPATGSTATYTGTSTAPTGTEKVHVEIVAESLATGWSVDNVSLVRLGTTSTAAQVITACLTDQDTGDQLFTPGVLNGSDTILADFHAIRLTNAEVLQAVARGGVALPEREWRYRPDNSFDFGTAEQLYTDRTDFTLRRDQLEVLQLPDVQETSEEQLTDVVVIGATRTAFNGRQYTITGSASVSPDALDLDWNGQPIHRVRVVEDSTMDNVGAANAYAAYLLGRSNTRQSVQLSLSDWRGYADGAFDVGDWIYPYEPDSGLVGDTPVTVDGQTIWPLKSRVLERTWKLGGGFSLKVRRPDGSLYDVPDELVRWEPDTSASVTVGDLLPEFAVNPQGRSASDQFLRYRASTPG
jgi:hypothetical protein